MVSKKLSSTQQFHWNAARKTIPLAACKFLLQIWQFFFRLAAVLLDDNLPFQCCDIPPHGRMYLSDMCNEFHVQIFVVLLENVFQ